MNYEDKALIEVHEIINTVEVVLASKRTFRLEVVRVAKGTADVHFTVLAYEEQELYKTSNGAITSEPVPGSIKFYVWVPDLNQPHVDGSEDGALQQALDWLAERRNNQNTSW